MEKKTRSTSLSAGLAVYALLTQDEQLAASVTKVFPVVTDLAELPYIAYRRVSMAQDPVKAGMPGADTVRMEVGVFTASYAEGVTIAEAVRRAMERKMYLPDGLQVRSCLLADAAEEWQDDAYVQRQSFDMRM